MKLRPSRHLRSIGQQQLQADIAQNAGRAADTSSAVTRLILHSNPVLATWIIRLQVLGKETIQLELEFNWKAAFRNG